MKGNFGFIHEKIDIKILILFILRHLQEPIAFDTLTELTMCDNGISYFDYAECVAELVRTEHLKLDDGKYSITAKGIYNGEVTEDSLPFSVRMIASASASALRAAQNRSSMIKALHTVNPKGGFTVNLTLSDGIGDIMSIDLFTANEQHAEALEKGFRDNAESIYNTITGMLLRVES